MGLSLCQNPVFIFIKENIYQNKMDCVKPTQETTIQQINPLHMYFQLLLQL